MHGITQGKPQLLLTDDVVPLRQSHVWKAAGTWVEAYKNDPQMRYLRDNEKQTVWTKAADRIAIASIMSIFIRSKVALTVNSGAAFVFGAPGLGEPKPKGPIDRAIDKIVGGLASILNRKIGSAEQRKRNGEFEEKYKQAVKRALGNRVKEMLCVMILTTEPASQGRGYGGALLDAMTSLADVTGQATWLHSTNIRNTEFYKWHGFEIVSEIVLGDQNPSWREAPVITRIMVREPRRRQ